MATTLSLEPLLHALPSASAIVSNKNEAGDLDGSSSTAADQHTLAARLQRLWQERGDFSKLSIDKLKSEDEQEALNEDDDVKKKKEDADQPGHGEGDDGQDGEESKAEKAEEEQSMTQEQLWELKLGILQGLDLARSDITSALDLLQLLLNPLNALAPPVPEEALALPSGSMSSSSLHTPLPPPADAIHLRNTALSLATKTKAIDTASDLLRSASKRLDRTTNKSQSEWTDLLRLKRSGQWKIEARPAQVPPQAGPSSAPFLPNIPIDKMAKDLCIFCGIEEAAYRWRQAGLVRLDNAANADKGKGKDKLNVPERLEGRRRMCVKVTIEGVIPKALEYRPTLEDPHEDDMHTALVQVQQELFEEEIFAELIREARDQPAGITATRNSIEIRHPNYFTLTVVMEDLDVIRETASESSKSSSSPLPQLLLLLARLQMIQIYKRRRRRTSRIIKDTPSSRESGVNITSTLRQLLLYYRHASSMKELLSKCTDALRSSALFDEAISLDFAACLSSPDSLLEALTSTAMVLEGTASLMMGSQSLNLSFSGASSVNIHLPTRNLPIRNVQDFSIILKRILKAAILKELEDTLKAVLKDVVQPASWEVIPTPKAVSKATSALARKTGLDDKLGKSEVEAYISILPTVAISQALPFAVDITLEAKVSARHTETAMRKTFTSSLRDEQTLHAWLRAAVETL
ncbi:hypothetical protein P389DRAFT_194953 [Cystobasidium minutum MCA 4210]|uniref:uncharacterized protein n=1 Tax=Cystobasidium minutum MCA 4210 TaxID=1397322 RepID=UPI0034CE1B9C|eukprot:jgi/Rhomi1/194953/gm1.3167_g